MTFTLFIITTQPYDKDTVLGNPRVDTSGTKESLPFIDKYLSAKNIDVFGRVSNFLLLLLVLVFNVVEVGARDTLGLVTIVVSVMTGLGWLYILFYALGFHQVVLYKMELWRFKATWAGIGEDGVKELVDNSWWFRTQFFEHNSPHFFDYIKKFVPTCSGVTSACRQSRSRIRIQVGKPPNLESRRCTQVKRVKFLKHHTQKNHSKRCQIALRIEYLDGRTAVILY